MRQNGTTGFALVAAVYFTGSAVVAQAQDTELPFDPVLSIGNTELISTRVVANDDGSFTLAGSQQGGPLNGQPVWSLAWDLAMNQDPYIAGSLTLTNLSSSTRNFNLALSLPVLPAIAHSQYSGNVSALLTDTSGDGTANLSPISVSPAIFRGTIDGATVLPLLGLTLNCSSGNPGCTAFAADSLDEMLSGPAVNSAIGIFLNFSLTPGDRVGFNTRFTVEPLGTVPLPAALPLLLGGIGILALGRRDKKRPA